jgi:hypothetical protein
VRVVRARPGPPIGVETVQFALAGSVAALSVWVLFDLDTRAPRLGMPASTTSDPARLGLVTSALLGIALVGLVAWRRSRFAGGVGVALLATAIAVGAAVGWARGEPAACGCLLGADHRATGPHLATLALWSVGALVGWLAVVRSRVVDPGTSAPLTST